MENPDFRVEGGPDGLLDTYTRSDVLRIPDYRWSVEVLPQIHIRSEERPSRWNRLWFRVFFGWQWAALAGEEALGVVRGVPSIGKE